MFSLSRRATEDGGNISSNTNSEPLLSSVHSSEFSTLSAQSSRGSDQQHQPRLFEGRGSGHQRINSSSIRNSLSFMLEVQAEDGLEFDEEVNDEIEDLKDHALSGGGVDFDHSVAEDVFNSASTIVAQQQTAV